MIISHRKATKSLKPKEKEKKNKKKKTPNLKTSHPQYRTGWLFSLSLVLLFKLERVNKQMRVVLCGLRPQIPAGTQWWPALWTLDHSRLKSWYLLEPPVLPILKFLLFALSSLSRQCSHTSAAHCVHVCIYDAAPTHYQLYIDKHSHTHTHTYRHGNISRINDFDIYVFF